MARVQQRCDCGGHAGGRAVGELVRFTDEEAITIDLASMGRYCRSCYHARYLNKVNTANFIDLQDADTIQGVYALEYASILGKDRTKEILETPVTEKERHTG